MATIINHKLAGQPFDAFRDVKNTTISAVFGLNVQPVLNVNSIKVTNTDKYLTSDKVRELQQSNPIEGATYSFEVADATNQYQFDFFLDNAKMQLLSDIETSIGLIKDSSLDSLLNYNGADITMTLLEYKNILTGADFENIPYVIHNRKTILEKLQLISQFVSITKTGIDEIFKLINIASDITTLGAIQAALNLTTTLLSLVVLVQQQVELIGQIHESFFPPVLYHSGIKLKTFLTKGCQYLGYNVEFGTVWEEINNIVLCPSKNDEQGTPVALPVVPSSGILKSQDFGHSLDESFQLAKKLGNVDIAIIDGTVHIRPKKDPFWFLNSSYVMPSVKIEESLKIKNGTQRYNYEDLHPATSISYHTDDSDYWTIQKLATSGETGDRISVTMVTPLSVTEQRRVKVGDKNRNIDIPYALCVRKDTLDDLLDLFLPVTASFDGIKDLIVNKFNEVADLFTDSFPVLANLETFIFNRDGAMKVENHFFSKPKIVYLDNTGKIPANFNDKIGARAIYNKYFAYDSLVQGIRNPLDNQDTNGKRIYKGVKIPFTIADFSLIVNNSYFSSLELGNGKIIKLDWTPDKDSAVIDFWIQDNWLTNVIETNV